MPSITLFFVDLGHYYFAFLAVVSYLIFSSLPVAVCFNQDSCDFIRMQGSPWTNNISLAILNFHESGVMEELETTWIDSKNCAEQSNSPATLGLSHMLGRKLLKVQNESFVTLIESPTKIMKCLARFHNAVPLISIIWIKSCYCFPCLVLTEKK